MYGWFTSQCTHLLFIFWSSSLILNIRIVEVELLTVAYTVNRILSCSEVCAGVRRWLRSWVVLSVPGMIFSILFTLPNYFQLSTVLRRDEVSLLDQDSQLYQVTS